MLGIYKTISDVLTPIDTIEPDSWINLIAPTADEINTVITQLNIEPEFIYAALDEEETSHIETEDNSSMVIVDIPYHETVDEKIGKIQYSTIPLGIVVTDKNVITICLKDTGIIADFSMGRVKSVYTNMRTRFVLQILYKMAKRFLQDLRQIDRASSSMENELHMSMRNKELMQLLELEKSLVFFSTSLKADEVTIEKIMRGRAFRMYEEDEELAEDVLIEIKQAIEMSHIYSNILSGTMDAFASIISNNINIVMKVMTSITILFAVPQVISGLYGMNVSGIPVPNFWFVILLSVFFVAVVALILYKKKIL